MNSTTSKSQLRSVAMRVHHMEAMLAFYTEAFGIQFEEVMTGSITSQFGEVDSFVLKFVPIRDDIDFEGYAVHQLGFSVIDVENVIEIAIQHGGRQEGEIISKDDGKHTAVRDPDGNTIELYSPD
ncbi:MAG: VOC family protein [Anaerolineales bacterium]|jgi:catechol 2,3-dioxygenase-like lactoylglutathione lyase family enzyme